MRLTFSEFELLAQLMSEPGRLFNRQELLRAIWGDSAYRDPRAIDVHIRHLREKLEETPRGAEADPDRARRRLPLPGAVSARRESDASLRALARGGMCWACARGCSPHCC